jgi:hypothetical protein
VGAVEVGECLPAAEARAPVGGDSGEFVGLVGADSPTNSASPTDGSAVMTLASLRAPATWALDQLALARSQPFIEWWPSTAAMLRRSPSAMIAAISASRRRGASWR